MQEKKARKQVYFGRIKKPLLDIPDLVQEQKKSYKELIEKGVREVFEEFSPIDDYTQTKFTLDISKFSFDKPKFDEYYAKKKKLTYSIPLKANVVLHNKITGEKKTQEIFFADFPYMTEHGTFIINGVERVIVPQLSRSYGIFFLTNQIKGKQYFTAKIIPVKGVWMEIAVDPSGVMLVSIDKKRFFPVSVFIKAISGLDNSELLKLFKDNKEAEEFIKKTLELDKTKDQKEAAVLAYKYIREGEVATPDTAKEFIKNLFNEQRYDLSEVGMYHLQKRFNLKDNDDALQTRIFDLPKIILVIKRLAEMSNDKNATPDDIDHLGFRRVRLVGEMLKAQMRVGMTRMKRYIQDRMSTIDPDTVLPIHLVNTRPFATAVMEFFATNQLSQFMDQSNPLSELENLRTVSALGPGGLTRERAGFDVRDVHTSHYGRLCPIQTPEGQNIGLILRLTVHARINKFGIIETPYAKVKNGKVTDEIVYLNAHEEENYKIVHAAVERDDNGKILEDIVEVRYKGEPIFVKKEEIDFIEVDTRQAFSVAASLIPFIEHDDANRALMGSNMQKQAVPYLIPEAPLVATGIEHEAIKYSGRLIVAEEAGEVTYVDARKIKVKNKEGKEKEYNLVNFARTNNMTFLHHRAVVNIGDKVKKGDVLADSGSSDNGQLALGQNVRVAFLSFSGANYEDAIIISERLVKNAKFTTIHIEEFVSYVRDTKLGPEVTTRDIPNVGEARLRDLDEEGIVRVGAIVEPGSILVGKVTPKGETQLTPEERLLRAIFGEKAKDVKDTSLRMPAGKRGKVLRVKVFSRENGDHLEHGIIKRIHIEVAQVRNVTVGDKLAGRHGNKGVISRVLPEEDMPFTEDGEPIDIILTPLGVPSRMNLGQILEMHLGLAAEKMGYQAIVPPFSGTTEEDILKELEKAGYSTKIKLFDGRTGEEFDQNIAVGNMYILRLHHMVEDKIHMRAIGPYSITTQQPLGGKSQNGGQRIGEMEVWAFLGYGAGYSLKEMLTIKSDDVYGRSAAFDAIIRGENITQTNVPATFHVLIRHLRGLALDVQLLKDKANK